MNGMKDGRASTWSKGNIFQADSRKRVFFYAVPEKHFLLFACTSVTVPVISATGPVPADNPTVNETAAATLNAFTMNLRPLRFVFGITTSPSSVVNR